MHYPKAERRAYRFILCVAQVHVLSPCLVAGVAGRKASVAVMLAAVGWGWRGGGEAHGGAILNSSGCCQPSEAAQPAVFSGEPCMA